MDHIDKSMIRRGAILQALQYQPSGLTDLALLAFLQGRRDNLSKGELRAELDYLAGRGKEYIEFVERASRLWIVKLTPAGMDLLQERRPEDTGVSIPR
jgi:hypothetical protein